jgi:hypothetical protein
MDNTSRKTYVTSHILVIVAHICMGAIILVASRRAKLLGWDSVTIIRAVAWILIVASALGLVPILRTSYPFSIE